MKARIVTAAATIALIFSMQHVQAQTTPEAKPLGKFGEWEAAFVVEKDSGSKYCYMAAKPSDTKSDKPMKGRDPAFLFITHWPSDDEKNAVTFSAGFTIKPGSKADVTVDGKSSFSMATGGREKTSVDADAQMAWMEDNAKEDELATAISKGSKLVVKTISKRGTTITDTYNLSGSGDAYKAISKECGY